MTLRYTADHLHLRSPDPEATARFYVEALQAQEKTRLETPSGLRIVLDLGGMTLFIETVPASLARPPEPPFIGIEHIGLGVTDMEAAIADLTGRGVRIVAAPKTIRPGISIAFIEGPDAVRIELIERRPA